ncbi:MAG: hypothetical protein ACYSSI_01325 [Planctomycetota bacterium]|jgi:hypothetical protein
MKKIIVILTLVPVVFWNGCAVVSVLGTPANEEIVIPAEYDLAEHANQKILVLVNQPIWIDAQINLKYYLTEAVNKRLEEKIKFPSNNIVSYYELSAYRSGQPDFAQLSVRQIGKGLNADIVLIIDVQLYQLEKISETDYYKGFLDAQAAVIDTATGTRLWPEGERGKTIRVRFEMEGKGRQIAVNKLIAACAHCTTRYLYNCKKTNFKIFEDKSDSVWQDWDATK